MTTMMSKEKQDEYHNPNRQRAHIDTGTEFIKRCFAKKAIDLMSMHHCVRVNGHAAKHRCGCGTEWNDVNF